MDSILPGQVLSEFERDRLARRRGQRRHLVVAGPRRHRLVELSAHGFVIEADDLPHLRGYVEILRGEERIARRLAQFAWARDGLVGYEFKLDAGAREAAADYAREEEFKRLAPPEKGGA